MLPESGSWRIWLTAKSSVVSSWRAAVHRCATSTSCQDPCGGMCGRAYCDVATKRCVCAPGYRGPPLCVEASGDMNNNECPGQCSGVGRCEHGVCICNAKYSGVDCSKSEGIPLTDDVIYASAGVGAACVLLCIGVILLCVCLRRRRRNAVLHVGAVDTSLQNNSESDLDL